MDFLELTDVEQRGYNAFLYPRVWSDTNVTLQKGQFNYDTKGTSVSRQLFCLKVKTQPL